MGYYSVAFLNLTIKEQPLSKRLKRVIKGYGTIDNLITLYNPFTFGRLELLDRK